MPKFNLKDQSMQKKKKLATSYFIQLYTQYKFYSLQNVKYMVRIFPTAMVSHIPVHPASLTTVCFGTDKYSLCG